MNWDLYTLKSEHGTIIKVPVPTEQGVFNYYFRRMRLGEWLSHQEHKGDPRHARALVETLLLDYFEVGTKADFLGILESRPGLVNSILEPIDHGSEFDNDKKIEEYYNKHQQLCYSNALVIVQMVLEAFPTYKIKDIMEMSAEDLMQAAAWAETKLEKPFFTEYVFFHDKYKAEYNEIFQDSSSEEFQYEFEMHIQLKNYYITGEKQEVHEDTLFIDDQGVQRRGDPEEYRKKREYFKDVIRRRKAKMPPLSMAEFYSTIDGEGIDPFAQKPETPEDRSADLTQVAAESSKMHLMQKLEKEKQLQMQGRERPQYFDWEEDKKSDMTWEETK